MIDFRIRLDGKAVFHLPFQFPSDDLIEKPFIFMIINKNFNQKLFHCQAKFKIDDIPLSNKLKNINNNLP